MNDFTKINCSITTLLELAKICKSVYGGPINHKKLTIYNEPIISQKIIHGSFGRGFCRLFWNDNYFIVAFRGTREIIDWQISNIKLFPVNLKNCGFEGRKIKVHFGFQKALYYYDKTTNQPSIDSLFEHIDDNNLLNGQRKILITGHSLGGAIATLFAVKLRFKCNDIMINNLENIVLFGSPSVGFKKFKDFYGELNDKTVRIINGSDIVPFTPPLFYLHIGKSVWFHNKKMFNNTSWLLRLLYSLKLPINKFSKDHSMTEYIKNLREMI